MHEEFKGRITGLENDYNGKEFRALVNQVKKDKINDDELLYRLETISYKRFVEKVTPTLNVPTGNLLEFAVTIIAIFLAFWVNSDWIFYLSTLILMTTLHPLSHFMAGSLLGIRFTHYYLNGPARIEPTLRIDHFSYLKASGKRRALMHVSGVIGTIAAPLLAAAIALYRNENAVAGNLFIFFLILIIFELLTSTRIGDLMRAKREYMNK